MFPGPNLSQGLPHPGRAEFYWGNFKKGGEYQNQSTYNRENNASPVVKTNQNPFFLFYICVPLADPIIRVYFHSVRCLLSLL